MTDWAPPESDEPVTGGAKPAVTEAQARAALQSIGVKPSDITSAYRTPEENTASHGAKHSLHLVDGAIDFRDLPKGMTPETFKAKMSALGMPVTEFMHEKKGDPNSTGNHYHWGFAPKGREASAPQDDAAWQPPKTDTVAKPSRLSTLAAQDVSRETKGSNPGVLDRLKQAYFVQPGQEEKAKPGMAGLLQAFTDIPHEASKQAHESLDQLKGALTRPLSLNSLAGVKDYATRPIEVAADALGYAMSPLTGAATSIVGRPVEHMTGLRREVTGDIVAGLVPMGEASQASTAAHAVPSAAAPASNVSAVAKTARNAGYVLPPQMITKKPGMVANALAGWSGKIKTQQAASARNQEITNALATKALGLPEGTPLTSQTFRTLRAQAGKAYEAVKNAVPEIVTDNDYQTDIASLGGTNSLAAKAFPGITKNQGILDLADELKSVPKFPTGAGVEVVKELRYNANTNLKAIGDPSKHALGLAQRQAADAVDDLIERNLTAAGSPGLVNEYKQARKLIAKSHDVEAATNPATGDVNARGIAKLSNKGKPLTDELKTIADVAGAFPKAVQSETAFGGNEAHSAVDFFGSALAMAHGAPDVAGAILARPIARHILLTDTVQNMLARDPGKSLLTGMLPALPATRNYILQNSMRRAPAVNALTQLSGQSNQP